MLISGIFIIFKKKAYMRITFIVILSFLVFFRLISNDIFYNDIKFEKYSIERGLSQSVVTFALKDAQGFMWFGTQDGLNKYDGYKFKIYRYTSSDEYSVSNNNISYLHEDQFGNIWIGTSGGGLNKYDRITDSFIRIDLTTKNGKETINTKYITSLLAEDTTLWIGTSDNGFLRYNIISNKVIDYYTIENSNLSSNAITNFTNDSNYIWIATIKGYNRFDKSSSEIKKYLQDVDEFGETYEILYIEAEENSLWLASWGNGLIHVDKNSLDVEYYMPEKGLNSIGSFYINQITTDKRGQKWIATWDGLSMYNIEKDFFYNWKFDNLNLQSLSNNNVNQVFIDNENIVWVSTWGGGINQFVNSKPQFEHIRKIPGEKNTLSHNSLWALFEDHSGNLWIGSEGGVTRYDPVKEKYKTFAANYFDETALGDNTVYCIFEDSRNIIWIGTWTGGLNRFVSDNKGFIRYVPGKNKNSLTSDIINNIIEDRNGILWISTANGLNTYNVDNNKFSNFKKAGKKFESIANETILISFEGSNGMIWIGTDGFGLYKYNPDNNELNAFTNNPEDKSTIINNVIFTIVEDDTGNIWCGTEAGLSILDTATQKFSLISKEHGLNNDVIYGILKNKNEFWLSTNNGLSRVTYDLRNDSILEIRNFDKTDNLQSTEFNLGAYHKSNSNYFYFGGINGFNKFHPDSIILDKSSPKIVFTDFKLFNESVPIDAKSKDQFALDTNINEKKTLELDFDQNIISIEFAALDYKTPGKISYKYQLEGFDEKWNYTNSSRRLITYTNLSPGTYHFKVKSISHHGFEANNTAVLKIIVHPPFWLTVWFYVIVFVIISGIIYFYVNYRERSLRKEKLILEKEVRTRTNEIFLQKQEMMDSIVYAKRIQTAVMPDVEILKEMASDYFVYYNPKSIVSGDFFWFSKVNNIKVYVVADCTGHGVPGAFMSMLGISFLNKIVNENKITDPSVILNKLRHNIITSLHQTDAQEINDGMELAIICINNNTHNIYYAGAMNPAYVIIKNELIELKPDTMPISLHFNLDQPFETKILKIDPESCIYLFTDGLIDQFGGSQNKRFKSKRLRKILSEIHKLPFNKQKDIIVDEYSNWKGKNEQIDDVLMVGFRP